jgi:UDP-GlcNAc:undecaprenyl-phosphate GlcNAc-1-phosphate transferase
MLKYLVLFFISLVLSFLLTPLVRSFAIKIKAIDLPGERKIHTRPIPRLGGLSIFIVFHLVLLAFSQFGFFHFPSGFLMGIHFGWILLASAIVLVLGSIDDFRRMPPSVKFLFQIVAGLIVALTCCRIEVIFLPFGTFKLGIFSVPATVFWVVAITNAVNLMDGLDGLAAGTSFIVCIAILGISLLGQNIVIALVSVILAGSILGFLRYNFHPASIFLGDSGSYFLGFIISLLSIMSGQKGTTTLAILVPIIALGLPIMDTALSMLRRLLKSLHIMEVDQEKNVVKFLFLDGWSVFKADRGHIHHKLLQMGFTQRKAVTILYAVSLTLGALALSSVYFKNINYALFITAIAFAFYVGVRKLGYTEIQILTNGSLLPLFNTPVVSRRILRVFVDMGLISFAYYLAFILRFEGEFSLGIKNYYLSTFSLILVTKITVFYLLGLYGGAWRYAGISDVITMIKAVVFGCIASALFLWIIPGLGIHSWAVLLIDFNLLLIFIVGARSSFRFLEQFHLAKNHKGRRVLIYGAGKRGVYAVKEFISNPRLDLSPIGFIDENPRYQGKRIIGFPVLGNFESLDGILAKNSISEVILCREDLSKEKVKRLAEICSSYHIPLRHYKTHLEEIPTGQK